MNTTIITTSNAPRVAGMTLSRARAKDGVQGRVTGLRLASKKQFVDAYMTAKGDDGKLLHPDAKRGHVEKVLFRDYRNQTLSALTMTLGQKMIAGEVRAEGLAFNKDGIATGIKLERPDVTSAAAAQMAVDKIESAEDLTVEAVAALEKKLAAIKAKHASASSTTEANVTTQAEIPQGQPA